MHQQYRILIVEDETLVSEMLRGILEDLHYTVVGRARDGHQAIEMTQNLRPDLILMDIELPGITGIETTRQIYDICPTPIIALTAYDTPELVERAGEAGVGSYLLKPPNAHEIERAITITLARFQDMTQLRSLNERLKAEIEERKQIEEALAWEADINVIMADLARTLLESTSIDDIADFVLKGAQKLTQSQFGFVGYIDPDTGYLISPTMTRDIWEMCRVPDKKIVFKEFTGLWGWVLRNRQALLTNAPSADLRSSGIPAGHLPIHRVLSVPAFIGDTLLGQITLANPPRNYTEKHLIVVERLASLYALALQRRHDEQALQQAKDAEEESRLAAEHALQLAVEAQKAADVANLAKSVFLATMSHELRTPLNGILGYAQILERDRQLTGNQAESIAIIRRSGDHLLEMINDVLDLSRVEAGKIELIPAEFPLAPALGTIVEIVRIRAHQQGITFLCEQRSDLPKIVVADSKRLRQVLLNLLGNAVKFTPAGSVTFRVRIVSEFDELHELPTPPLPHSPTHPLKYSPTQTIRFEVEDTGLGIAADKLEDIFEPFQQAHRHLPQIEGTGLGLAISQRILRLMNSTIHVHSTPGKGSRFWFDLELPYKDAPHVQKHPPVQRIIGITGPPPTILIVDDKTEERRILHDMLQPLGFNIVEALNGEDALQKADSVYPDAILLDIVMPGLNGLDVIRHLRDRGRHDSRLTTQRLLILAVSASAFEHTRHDSLEAGCDAFLSKPIQFNRLLELLHAHLSIEWLYEPDEKGPNRSSSDDALVPPSQEDLRRLYDLASIGDISEIFHQLQVLEAKGPQHHPFIAHISGLANTMQASAIEAFVEQYLTDV